MNAVNHISMFDKTWHHALLEYCKEIGMKVGHFSGLGMIVFDGGNGKLVLFFILLMWLEQWNYFFMHFFEFLFLNKLFCLLHVLYIKIVY